MLYQLSKPIDAIEPTPWSIPTSATSSTSGSSDLTDLEEWSSGGGSDRESHQESVAHRGSRRANRRHHAHPPTSDESARSTEEETQSTPPTSTGSQPSGKNQSAKVQESASSHAHVEGGRTKVGTKSLAMGEAVLDKPVADIELHAVVENKIGLKREAIVVTPPKMEAKVNNKECVRNSTVKKSSPREYRKSGKSKSPEKKIEKRRSSKNVKRKKTPRTKEEKLADLDAQVEMVHKGIHPLFIQRTASAKIIYESKTRQNDRQLSHSLQSYKDLEDMAKRAGRQWFEAKQLETRQTLIEQVKLLLRKLDGDWKKEKSKDAGGEFHTTAQSEHRQVRRQNREYGRIAVSQIQKATGYEKRRKRGFEEEAECREGGEGRRVRRRNDIRRTRAVQVAGCSPMEAEEDLALMGCN